MSWVNIAVKLIPWDTVAKTAPHLITAAKSIWPAGTRLPSAKKPADALAAALATSEAKAASIEARLAAMEAAADELGKKVAMSAEVVTSLAEQNAQLELRLDALRTRLVWTWAATGASLLLATIALATLATR